MTRERKLHTLDVYAGIWLVICGLTWSSTVATSIKYIAAVIMLLLSLLKAWNCKNIFSN